MDSEKQTSSENELKNNKVPFTYLYISSDVVLRFICLWLYKIDICNGWFFWLSQLVLIPVIVMFIAFFNGAKETEEIYRKDKGLSKDEKLDVEGNAKSVIFCLIVIGTATYVAWNLFSFFPLWLQINLSIVIFIFYGALIWFIFTQSYAKKKVKKPFRVKNKKHQNYYNDLSIDGNDENLVKLEISLSQFSSKVDTYTLESALLGALSFSGFLAILSLDSTIVSNIHVILTQLSIFFNNLISLNINKLPEISLNQQSILSILAIEAIICSFFFLLVIVSRIRFHDTLCLAELYIKMAREFNNKEEEYDLVYHQAPSKTIQDRLDFLNAEIKKNLNIGSQRKKELDGIVMYMNYVRNIGLFLFIIILSTSACLVSYKLSIIFLILYIMSYSYHKIDSWAKDRSWKRFFNN